MTFPFHRALLSMNVLVALFSVASLIWLVPVIQRGRLLAIAMLTLGVGTVLGPYFFAIDGPIQFSLDRILWIAMFGLSLAGWRLGHVRIPAITRMDWVVMAIVGWFLISALARRPSAPEKFPRGTWLFYVAMPAGMYLIARIVPVRSRDIQWLTLGLVGLGLYLAVTAMFEVCGSAWARVPAVHRRSGIMAVLRSRPRSVDEPIRKWLPDRHFSDRLFAGNHQIGSRGKLLYGVALVILLGGLYATLTRSIWLGGLGGLAMVGLVYSPRWIRVLGLATVVLLGGVCSWGQGSIGSDET